MGALDINLFLIKQQIGLFRAAFSFDVIDPATGVRVMACREHEIGRIARIFRYSQYRRSTPFNIAIDASDGTRVARVSRGVPVWASRVKVMGGKDELIGGFRQRRFVAGGAFDVVDATGLPAFVVKGELTGWNFRFTAPGDVELARVTKKWAGLGKELLTSADDYMLEIDDAIPARSTIRRLIVASVIGIDLVLKPEIP